MATYWQNGKWWKDGKEVTPAEVRASIKPVQHEGYGPLPNDPEAKAAEMSQRVLESGYAGSVDSVPLWRKGERKMYDSDSGDGVHTFAELIEIDDDLKHAYD